MPPERPAQERVYKTAQHIAAKLGETEAVPVSQIRRSVEILGEDQALQLLEQALVLQEQGGQLLPDESRRRTTGGVFFRLVRERTTPEQHQRIWFFRPRQTSP